ncbi:hypothetical protein CBOM_07863 [Ceraceosorus bombacis]|uniref:Uncharacterized protein n=1 Tax=Ceraceosorus bombacis TaxID=401625 RepID=A0A0P1BND3_9BASI|nr:hypothetical protein CBOM_07863 [Ceraceosorus bombacis]
MKNKRSLPSLRTFFFSIRTFLDRFILNRTLLHLSSLQVPLASHQSSQQSPISRMRCIPSRCMS